MSYAREYNLGDGDTVYAEQYNGEIDNLYDAINAVDAAKLDESEVAVSGANKVLRLNASGATGVNTTGNADTATLATTATTATNIAGGAAGSIPYQSAEATTAMLASVAADAGKPLVSGGAGAPSWGTGFLKLIGDTGWQQKANGDYHNFVFDEDAGDLPPVIFVYTADDTQGTGMAIASSTANDSETHTGIQVRNITSAGCRIQLSYNNPFLGLTDTGHVSWGMGYTSPDYIRAVAFKIVV
jgi:hypothetical protein